MNKKLKIFAIIGATLGMSAVLVSNAHTANYAWYGDERVVDFFDNYLREEFTLSNGFQGRGNNLLYTSIKVQRNSLITKPDDPTRRNYEFQGWFKEKTCENEWDFTADRVLENTRLFAKWGYSTADIEPEPEYIPPSTVLEENASTDFVINSVMNFKLNGTQVKVSIAAIAKLEANASNVLPLMEYKVKAYSPAQRPKSGQPDGQG